MSELSEKDAPVKRNAVKRLKASERAQRDQEEALKMMGITGVGDSLEVSGRRTRSSLRGTPTTPATPPPTKKSTAATPTSRRGKPKPKRLHAEEEIDSKEVKLTKLSSVNEKEKSTDKIDGKTKDEIEVKSSDENDAIKEDDETDDSEMNVIDEKKLTAVNKEVKVIAPTEIKEHIVKNLEENTLTNSVDENSEVDGNKLDTIKEKEEDVAESIKIEETVQETSKQIQSKDEKINNVIQDTKNQLNDVEPMEVDGEIESKEDKIESNSIENDASSKKTSIELNNDVNSNDCLSSSSQDENTQKVSIPSSTADLPAKSISENNISHEEKNLIEIENNKNESVEESNKNENDVCEVKLTTSGEIAPSQTCK